MVWVGGGTRSLSCRSGQKTKPWPFEANRAEKCMAFKAAANLTAAAAASLSRSAEFAYLYTLPLTTASRRDERTDIRRRLIKMIDISASIFFSAQFVNHMAGLWRGGDFFIPPRFCLVGETENMILLIFLSSWWSARGGICAEKHTD